MKEMVNKDLINLLAKFNDELTKLRPENRIVIDQIGRKYIKLNERDKSHMIRPICFIDKNTGDFFKMKSKYQASDISVGSVFNPCKLKVLKKDLV